MKKNLFYYYSVSLILLFSCNEPGINDNPGGGPEPSPLRVYYGSPAWHPSGKFILAVHSDSIDTNGDSRNDDKFYGLWSINPKDGNKRPFLKSATLPSFSRDGKKIAFVINAQIYVADLLTLAPPTIDTLKIVQITNEGANFFPDLNSDGSWVAFDSNIDTPNGMYFIWIMKSDGTQKKRVVYEPTKGEIRMPNWSADDKNIVHQRYLDTNRGAEIVIMDSDGKNPTRITYDENFDRNPKYSPSGKQIAYVSQERMSGVLSIKIIDAESGQELNRIITATDFDWSPSGNEIVFLLYDFKSREREGNGHLWISNLDGTNAKRLTK